MYWFRDFTLGSAFEKLRAVRPCNSNLQAIRQATCDTLLDQGKTYPAKIAFSEAGSDIDIKVSTSEEHLALKQNRRELFEILRTVLTKRLQLIVSRLHSSSNFKLSE